ncbi:MAG: transposase [Armatimonadetes bacterium]|nr:transposase [Armatimonadota bacterium]
MRRRVFNTPGEAHGLTFSTYRRTKVFTEPRFCGLFLDVLDRERKNLKFEVWAYVPMPDHAHVLIWPTERDYDVSEILRAVKQPVSARILSLLRFESDPRLPRLWNEASQKHRLWQAGGGYDRNLVSRGLLAKTIDTIHDNPVVAGISKLPWDYEWSSAGFYQGLSDGPFKVDRYKG